MSALALARLALAQRFSNRIQSSLKLPGASGNYASVPNNAAFVPAAGVLRIEAKARITAANQLYTFASIWDTANNKRSYKFFINTTGFVRFQRSTNGSGAGAAVNSSVEHGVAAGGTSWFAVEWNITGGTVDYELSTDGSTWTALGTQQTLATAPFGSDAILELGGSSLGTADMLAGNLFMVRLYVDDVLLMTADFTKGPFGFPATLRDSTGNAAITLNRSGATPAAIVNEEIQ